MARRKTRTRTVYRKARGGYRARKGLISGQLMNVVIGAAAGAAAPMIPRILGKWTLPVLFGAAGYFFKKPVLMGIAGYELGRGFTLPGGGVGNGGFVGQG